AVPLDLEQQQAPVMGAGCRLDGWRTAGLANDRQRGRMGWRDARAVTWKAGVPSGPDRDGRISALRGERESTAVHGAWRERNGVARLCRIDRLLQVAARWNRDGRCAGRGDRRNRSSAHDR